MTLAQVIEKKKMAVCNLGTASVRRKSSAVNVRHSYSGSESNYNTPIPYSDSALKSTQSTHDTESFLIISVHIVVEN